MVIIIMDISTTYVKGNKRRRTEEEDKEDKEEALFGHK